MASKKRPDSLTGCLFVQHLRANLPSYEVGLYEQNVLTFLMYTQPELLDNAVFDISSYGLNCWYRPLCFIMFNNSVCVDEKSLEALATPERCASGRAPTIAKALWRTSA